MDRTLFVMTRGAMCFKKVTLEEYLQPQRCAQDNYLSKFVLEELSRRVIVVENDRDVQTPQQLAEQRDVFFRHLAHIVLNKTPYTNQLFQEAEERRKTYQQEFHHGGQLALPGTFAQSGAFEEFIVKLRFTVDRWIANGEIDISAVQTCIQEKLKYMRDLLSKEELDMLETYREYIESDIETYVQKNHQLIRELGERARQNEECFPGFCKMYTKEQGMVRMDCLQVGDRVLTTTKKGSLSFGNVFCFSHAEQHAVTSFLQITTFLGKTVTLSPNHLLPVNITDALRAAKDVSVGDHVFVCKESAEEALVRDEVVSVSMVIAEGLYCPHTSSGCLVVDDVLVSCYTTVLPPWAQHVLLTPFAWLYRWLPSSIYDRVVPYHKETGMPYIVKLLRTLV